MTVLAECQNAFVFSMKCTEVVEVATASVVIGITLEATLSDMNEDKDLERLQASRSFVSSV